MDEAFEQGRSIPPGINSAQDSRSDLPDVLISGDQSLTPAAVYSIAAGYQRLSVCPSLEALTRTTQENLDKAVREDRAIYGITSGFGPLVQYQTNRNDLELVQKNLVYHLATGVGEPLSYTEARALMVSRLNVISRPQSAASMVAIKGLANALNAGLAAFVPQKGTVGASGDLTPSAHMVLSLMGEAAWITPDGTQINAEQAAADYDIHPLQLKGRDCLALVNGTSCMTGLACLSLTEIKTLVSKALQSCVAVADLYCAQEEAYDALLAAIRPHAGQIRVTDQIATLLKESTRLKGPAALKKRKDIKGGFQDPYSIRCLPQAFGAVLDLVDAAENFIATELNAVTDNPVATQSDPAVVHGGNFYGQHVAFASDMLGAACTKIAIILERQIDLLCDTNRNGGYPSFLCSGQLGQNSGLMGAQVTASALLAEMRTQSGWASLQAVPTNGHNQDINTMGTTAGRLARRNIDDLSAILAIHAIACSEYYDRIVEKSDLTGESPATKSWVLQVRSLVEPLDKDRPLSQDIKALSLRLKNPL